MRPFHRSTLALAISLTATPGFAAEVATTTAPTSAQASAYLQTLLVKSPYRLPVSARAGEIQYRLVFANPRAWNWPQTGEQRARIDDRGVLLSICADCGDETAPTDDMLQQYLAANAWVRSDDRRIRGFARQSARGLSVKTRMRHLAEAVRKHMTGPIDYRYYHDAVTALDSRSGDCTEFAVLLAATARSLHIPTRVVHGIAYSGRFTGQTHVFSPHAWVQAWDGERWLSYDAALGNFDAGHIALVVGNGDPAGLRGVNKAIRDLRITEAAGIQRTPAATSD